MALPVRKAQHGFTIAELITVIAIIGILAAMAMPVARFGLRRQKEIDLHDRLRKITDAIDRYHDYHSLPVGNPKRAKDMEALGADGYPKEFDDLIKPLELTDGTKVRLLRPRDLVDPMTGDGLHFKLTVPQSEGMEVNICDGTSPAGGKPYEMKWIMMHKQAGEPVKSQVLGLMETYRDQPVIQQATNLAVSGEDESGYAAAGCVVKLADRTDTLFASADPKVARTAEGGFKFAGRFGLWAEKDGVPVAMSLVGGTELSKGNFGIKIDQPEYRAKITKVDRKTDTITVSPAPPAVEAIKGATIFLTSGSRRLAYKVLAAKAVAGGVELRLNMDSRIGTGQVTGVKNYIVETQTPFTLHSWGYYEGARIVNEAKNVEYKVNEVRSQKAAYIDPVRCAEAKAETLATQFPKDSWFEVYDYGVGDEVVWPYAISVTRTGQGIYQVKSPVPVTLNLPEGR
jgi:prepilin-type N-terminal cleavage/methylation domain-containing protein